MKNLPQYKLSLSSVLVLCVGGIVPSALVVIILQLLGKTTAEIQGNMLFSILTNLAMWVGAIVAFDYFVCRVQTGKKLKFDFSTKDATTYMIIFPMMFGMMLITEVVTNFIPTEGAFFGELYRYFKGLMDLMISEPLSMFILAVIIAPIFEEIVFRGIIMKGLINAGISPNKAIIFSAVVFGLVHLNPWQLVGGVLLGFVLGKVYYYTQSLLMPILLHTFNNLCSTLLITCVGTESFSVFFGVPPMLMAVLGILIFTIFYYWFNKKYGSVQK